MTLGDGILWTTVLILLAGTANAETFQCQAGQFWYDGGTIVVSATINEDGESGTIEVAGVKYATGYMVVGFNRRWDWTDGDGINDGNWFAFVIYPSGAGSYVNFGSGKGRKNKKADQFFTCK